MTAIFHMDRKKDIWKVCICTNNMKNVNLPFGKTDVGFIYKVERKKEADLQEQRILSSNGIRQGRHDFVEDEKVQKIKDCDYIVCTKIGNKLKRIIEVHGVSVIEYQGDIKTVLEKLRKYLLLTRQER